MLIYGGNGIHIARVHKGEQGGFIYYAVQHNKFYNKSGHGGTDARLAGRATAILAYNLFHNLGNFFAFLLSNTMYLFIDMDRSRNPQVIPRIDIDIVLFDWGLSSVYCVNPTPRTLEEIIVSEPELKSLYGHVLMASYLYYCRNLDSPWPDPVFDKACRDLLDHWDEWDHRYKHLCDKKLLSCGTLYTLREYDYPEGLKHCAFKWRRDNGFD